MPKQVLNRAGLVFAIMHLLAFVLFVYYLFEISGRDGQSQLYWAIWLILDFPVSLIIVVSFWLDFYSYGLLYFTHGIMGTVFWYFIGQFPSQGKRDKKIE